MEPVSLIVPVIGGLLGRIFGDAIFEPQYILPPKPSARIELKYQDNSEAKRKAERLLHDLKSEFNSGLMEMTTS